MGILNIFGPGDGGSGGISWNPVDVSSIAETYTAAVGDWLRVTLEDSPPEGNLSLVVTLPDGSTVGDQIGVEIVPFPSDPTSYDDKDNIRITGTIDNGSNFYPYGSPGEVVVFFWNGASWSVAQHATDQSNNSGVGRYALCLSNTVSTTHNSLFSFGVGDFSPVSLGFGGIAGDGSISLSGGVYAVRVTPIWGAGTAGTHRTLRMTITTQPGTTQDLNCVTPAANILSFTGSRGNAIDTVVTIPGRTNNSDTPSSLYFAARQDSGGALNLTLQVEIRKIH